MEMGWGGEEVICGVVGACRDCDVSWWHGCVQHGTGKHGYGSRMVGAGTTTSSVRDEGGERELVARLRGEAATVKDCFTRFSFQALAIGAAALGVELRYMWEVPESTLLAFAVVPMLDGVCRIGSFKYATANRLLGFELHLTRTLEQEERGRWESQMRVVDWEEAMRAWRVVQASVFNEIYRTPSNCPRGVLSAVVHWCWQLRPWPLYRHSGCWFEPESLVAGDRKSEGSGRRPLVATYHAGSYLSRMFSLLTAMELICVMPAVVVFLVAVWAPGLWDDLGAAREPWLVANVGGGVLVALLTWMLYSMRLQGRRREIVEGGLLSIHSCAVMWQVVLIVHWLAKRGGPGGSPSYRGYTTRLGAESLALVGRVRAKKGDAATIHDWIDMVDE